jgi:hypothetical protein
MSHVTPHRGRKQNVACLNTWDVASRPESTLFSTLFILFLLVMTTRHHVTARYKPVVSPGQSRNLACPFQTSQG